MNILLAEDDVLTRTLLTTFLEERGCRVIQAGTLIELNQILQSHKIDIAVLDQVLEDGETIPTFLEMTPDPSIKIICITSNSDQKKKNDAVGAGILSYLFKPIDEEELFVRIQMLFNSGKETSNLILTQDQKFKIDLIDELLKSDSKTIKMTGTEIALLKLFVESTSQTFTRETLSMKILDRHWQADDRSLDVLVGRIRKKMSAISCPSNIITVRGKGYRFEKH